MGLRSSMGRRERRMSFPSLSVSQLLVSPADHRVTLTRPRLLRRALVITTNANPSHAHALRDLRYQFKAVTGRPYLPRRGDILTHTF